METRIEQGCPPTERLQTSAHLAFMLQDGDLHTVLGQNVTTFQAAQSSSYDNDTLLFHCLNRFEKKG